MAHAPVPRAIPMPSARPFAQASTPAPSASLAKAMGRATLTPKLPCGRPLGRHRVFELLRGLAGRLLPVPVLLRRHGWPVMCVPSGVCWSQLQPTVPGPGQLQATASAMTGPQAMAVARATRAGALCTVFCSSQAASRLGMCVAGQHQHWGWIEQLRVCLRGSVCSGHGRGNLNPNSKHNMTVSLPPTVQRQKFPENYRALFTRKENGGEQKRHERPGRLTPTDMTGHRHE